MATPRYVAKKIGNDYVIERTDPAAAAEGAVWTAVGGVVALSGFVRGGPLGWLATFGGLSMICRGVTGKNPFERIGERTGICCQDDAKLGKFSAAGPSHQNDARPTRQVPQDATEEASMQSFPGSDPPARSGIASVGGG